MEGKFFNLNRNLGTARRNRNDEFYTQLADIERELRHYRHHFKDKTVYCNCDDPRVSNFFHYFSYNFERLGLKKLITTCYQNQEMDLFSQHDVEQAISLEYTGEELYPQELRNAVYHGSWVTDAKRHFSKSNCPAYAIGRRYLNGVAIRQDYLETAIKWFNNSNNTNEIEEFMSKNHHKPSANELWRYFQNVISWVESVFRIYRREMKGISL